MGSIIFLPGILGSELFLENEMVWPPTIREAAFGYKRIAQLLDAGVRPGNPILRVACVKVYGPLLDDLARIAAGAAGGPRRRLHAIGYDWRLDITKAAQAVSVQLSALPPEDRDEIRIVAHSMGCLVARVLLESGTFNAEPWFAGVRSFTSLAGPHLGSPTALVRALGLEGSAGLSGPDIRRMAQDPRYPSLYQLLPAPGIAALLDGKAGRMAELDLYSKPIAQTLGLSPANLKAAKSLHGMLAKNRRPKGVEYVYLAGSGSDTVLRVDLFGERPIARVGQEAGDGTVPLWSAVDPTRVHHSAPATHQAVFRNEQIRTMLYHALGAQPPAASYTSGDGKPLVQVFATQAVFAPATPVDLLVVPQLPTRSLSGEIVIETSAADDPPVFVPFLRQPFRYEGPPVDSLKVRLDPPGRTGFFRVTVTGTHETDPGEGAVFGVSDVGGVAPT